MNGPAATLIHGRWLVRDWTAPPASGVLEDGALYQEAGTIVDVGSYAALRRRYPSAQHVGDADTIVIPGFVNAHSHGRGVTTFQKRQRDEHLELRVLDLMARSRDAPAIDPRLDILWSCVKQIACGITTTVHSHSYYQGTMEGYARGARTLVDAYRESGLRCVVALGIRDRNRLAYREDAFTKDLSCADCEAIASFGEPAYVSFDEYHALLGELEREQPQASFQFGPTNPVWCSERLLGSIADASRASGRRVHTHLAETQYQAAFARKAYGKGWAEALVDLGLLSDRLSCAHGVWLDANDLQGFAQAHAQVVHNPASNLRLSSGIAPLRRFLEHGVPVAMGTDSLAMNDDEDIFQDMRLAALLQNVPGVRRAALDAATVLGMATRGGAIVAGNPKLGMLAAGSPADAVLVSASKLAGFPGLDPVPLADWVLARATASCVQSVMIGGHLVLESGRWTTLEPERIAAAIGSALDARAAPPDAATRALKAALRDYYERSVQQGASLYRYNDGN
jgi:cytosine/adenosine deaminase-related metal-dependent hydrolase